MMAGAKRTSKYIGNGPIPEDIHQAARLTWESSRDMTHAEVAEAFNLATATVKVWSSKEKWSKAYKESKGQVIPAPQRALRTVRREMAASEVRTIDEQRMRWLAQCEHNRQRDMRARQMDAMQMNLAAKMYDAAIGPIGFENDQKVARLKVAIDAISKLHQATRALWRIEEGAVPVMIKQTIIDVSPELPPENQ